jgi:hypothetical protein
VNFQQKIVLRIVKPNAKIFHVKSEEVYIRIEKPRAAKVGAEAQSFLNNGQVHEAYRTI